jgi:hypothetical protein
MKQVELTTLPRRGMKDGVAMHLSKSNLPPPTHHQGLKVSGFTSNSEDQRVDGQ